MADFSISLLGAPPCSVANLTFPSLFDGGSIGDAAGMHNYLEPVVSQYYPRSLESKLRLEAILTGLGAC